MAERGRHPWATKPMREVFDAILSLESRAEVESFLRDLCTMSELEAMAHRWQVAQLLEKGLAVPGDRGADARLDDDRDARGALAEARRRRLQAGARPQAGRTQLLKVAAAGQGPPARAVVQAARGRRPRPGAAGRARARVPVPQRAGRGAARARGRHPRVRAGRRRRLRDHRHRPRPRARRPRQRGAEARLRLVPPRGGGARPSRRTSGSRISPASRSRPSIRG